MVAQLLQLLMLVGNLPLGTTVTPAYICTVESAASAYCTYNSGSSLEVWRRYEDETLVTFTTPWRSRTTMRCDSMNDSQTIYIDTCEVQ